MGVKLGLSYLGNEHRLRVFENRVMRRSFGPKREKVTGDYLELRNYLYFPPSVIPVIKSRRTGLATYVAHTGTKGNACEDT